MAILLNSNKRVAFKGYFYGGYYMEDRYASLKFINASPVWIELRDGAHIMLHNIPPWKSLVQAVSDYFNYYNYGTWKYGQNYMRISCDNCEGVTVYGDPNCLPFAAGDYGQLVCPHCNQPWLTYKYGE